MQKSIFKRLICASVAALVVLALVFPVTAFSAGDATGNTDIEAALAGFEKISGQSRLVLYGNKKNGEIAVQDKKTGETWFSNPPGRKSDKVAVGFYQVALNSQILISYTNNRGVVLDKGSFLHSVQKGGLSYEMRGESIIFRYDFKNDKIMIPVMYTIKDDYLSAQILTDEIKEYGDNEILTIDLLPYFGAGGVLDEGYLMVPDGSGAVIYMNNGKTTAADYTAPVYGEDNGCGGLQIPASAAELTTITNSEKIRIPVFGMKKNSAGYLAVITSSSPRTAVKASVSGKGTSYNTVSSRLFYRMSGTVLLTQKEFSERKSSIGERLSAKGTPYEVCYFFLDKEKCGYAGMAEKYREYQESAVKLESKVKQGDIPLYLDLYGYVNKVKPFLGIPVERVIPLTTLEDIRTIAGQLTGRGIKNIAIKYNAWIKSGSFKKIPSNARFEGKLGSAGEFKILEKELSQKGVSIYLSSDLINVYKTGNGFSKYADSLKSVANTPLMQIKYVLDSASVDLRVPRWYLLNPLKYGEFFNRYIKDYVKLGSKNISLDNIGDMCYSDMSSRGVSRTDIPGIVEQTLKSITGRVPSLMISGANSYAVPYAEHVINTPSNASFYDIIDEHIPFYQIVYHGIINYSLEASNLSSNPEYVFLKCLETGASPMYSWVGRNSEELFNSRLDNLYSADYRAWMDSAVSSYKEINTVLSKVSTQYITAHEKLSDNVYMTTYGGSVSVIVNYNAEAVEAKGVKVDGLGYSVIEVGGAQ